MATIQKNRILYIGEDENYAQSISEILNCREESFQLEYTNNLQDIKEAIQSKAYGAFLFDAALVKHDGQHFLEQVLSFSNRVPIVLIVDEEQKEIGQYGLEKGAVDYIVRLKGALTSIPFTVDRAMKYKVEPEKVPFEFKIESELKETSAFFEINESGRFLSFDDNLSKILGLSKEQFYQSYLMDFIADEDRDRFYRWRASPRKRSDKFTLQTEVIHREKGIIPVELQLQPYSAPEAMISGFRGYMKILTSKPEEKVEDESFDPLPFFHEIYLLNGYLRQGLNQLFMMKLAEIPKKFFRFGHASLYFYSPQKNRYQRELSVGEELKNKTVDLRSDYFWVSEIEQLFKDGRFVQFVHQSVLNDQERKHISSGYPAYKFLQEKQWETDQQWQIGDRLFLNLKKSDNSSIGFIILEAPESGRIPNQQIKKQAELYAIFVSSLFESHFRYENLENKYKQFKQIFTLLETFNIDLPVEGLLKEAVWTIRFSLGFNFTALAVFSKTTHLLHIKAVAVEGKEKARVLSRIHFTLKEITPWLREKFRVSNSYLITDKNSNFHLMKRIYGLPLTFQDDDRHWQYQDLLLVPIRMSNKNIIGFIILDDPADKLKPSVELVQIVEKVAKLVAVTIENKVIHTKLKSDFLQLKDEMSRKHDASSEEKNRIKSIFKRVNLSK